MRILFVALLIGAVGGSESIIITRHDTPDDAYVAFAEKLPVTSAIIRYNSTDVAGTLIAPQWILSAAHVAETIEPGQMLLASSGDSVGVEEIILHPGWIEDGRPEDIALIRLAQPVPGIRPVGLYTGRDEEGEEVIIAGNGDFGTGLTGPEGNDGKMRAATNRVDEATENYLTWRFDDPREHPERATALEGISGPGDSSGPAFIQVEDQYLIAGISSGQSTQATDGQEGLYGVVEYYTRVSTYEQWIREAMSD